jgi:hypothetical protein
VLIGLQLSDLKAFFHAENIRSSLRSPEFSSRRHENENENDNDNDNDNKNDNENEKVKLKMKK